ncbi:MAG: dTMP kinase [Verrucomicrobiota bacterium]
MSGFFVSFEGGEGSGKSTQIRALARHLEGRGKEVYTTREPGGTPLGEAIRNLLQHDASGENMSPEAELLLFAASRAQLTSEQIRPALEAGKVVLCDRYMDSTTVYQGVARALAEDQVAVINHFAVGKTRPDLTILIDLDPVVGLERVQARSGGALDRMESENIGFFHAVRQGYLTLAQAEPDRFLIINGDQPAETIETEIRDAVRERLEP